jgi:dihydrofolate reductase
LNKQENVEGMNVKCMNMKAIAAVDANWGIGMNGRLLARLPADLKRFREITTGNVIVVGRETLESFPGKKPLPHRTTVCLTRNRDYKADCVIAHSMDECLKYLSEFSRGDIYIAGGESVYAQFLPYCDCCLITKMEASLRADRFFINLDNSEEFKLESESEAICENGITYRFMEYRRTLCVCGS